MNFACFWILQHTSESLKILAHTIRTGAVSWVLKFTYELFLHRSGQRFQGFRWVSVRPGYLISSWGLENEDEVTKRRRMLEV